MTTSDSMIDRLGGSGRIQEIIDEVAGYLRGDEVLAPLVTGEAFGRLQSHVELALMGCAVDADIAYAIMDAMSKTKNVQDAGITSRFGEMVTAFDSMLHGQMGPFARLMTSLSDDDLVTFMAAGNVITGAGELTLGMRARARGIS